MSSSPPPLLEARDLVKQYGATRVVDGVSLTLHRGETLGLVGESGSGKSTVARLLLRLIEPTAGHITLRLPSWTGRDTRDPTSTGSDEPRAPSLSASLQPSAASSIGNDRPGAPSSARSTEVPGGRSLPARVVITARQGGVPPNPSMANHESVAGHASTREFDLLHVRPRELRRLRRRLAIVFQDPYAALDPRMTVRQILAEPFAIHREQPSEGLDARLHQMLAEVGLDPSSLRRYPHEFSGGQRQRINIARALALRPELLVLDEPVSALDVSVGAQIVNLLRDLQARHGLTCLFISHSMPLVRYLCHRVAVMQRGRVVEQGTWQQVCECPGEPYTRQLLAATPELPVATLS